MPSQVYTQNNSNLNHSIIDKDEQLNTNLGNLGYVLNTAKTKWQISVKMIRIFQNLKRCFKFQQLFNSRLGIKTKSICSVYCGSVFSCGLKANKVLMAIPTRDIRPYNTTNDSAKSINVVFFGLVAMLLILIN